MGRSHSRASLRVGNSEARKKDKPKKGPIGFAGSSIGTSATYVLKSKRIGMVYWVLIFSISPDFCSGDLCSVIPHFHWKSEGRALSRPESAMRSGNMDSFGRNGHVSGLAAACAIGVLRL